MRMDDSRLFFLCCISPSLPTPLQKRALLLVSEVGDVRSTRMFYLGESTAIWHLSPHICVCLICVAHCVFQGLASY